MDYYKTLYESEVTWGRNAASRIGKTLGKLEYADSVLGSMDAFMSPEQFEETIKQVRELIKDAQKTLDSKEL